MCLLAYNIILSVKCNENDTHCLVSRKYYAPCLLSIMAKRSINSSSRNCHNSLVVQRTESKNLAEFTCNMKNIAIYLNDISIYVHSTYADFQFWCILKIGSCKNKPGLNIFQNFWIQETCRLLFISFIASLLFMVTIMLWLSNLRVCLTFVKS